MVIPSARAAVPSTARSTAPAVTPWPRRTARERVLGRGLRAVARWGRIASDPATRHDERILARLESGTPFASGAVTLDGLLLSYSHPQSLAAQYRDIFQQQIYRFETDRADPRIIDVGANIGLATLYWKRRYPRARISAFEPDPDIADLLVANLGEAGVADVDVIRAAAWTNDGNLSFRRQGAGGGRLAPGDATVETRRMRDVLDEPIDLLKIDIEGAEVDVLADSAPALCNVARLFVEFHSFVDQPQRFGELTGLLADAGYRVLIQTEACPAQPFVEVFTDNGMDMQLNVFAYRP